MEALLEGIRQREQTGGFLTSCEAELQELLRQIDIMVTHKKSEWESQTNVLATRLELREQELSSFRASMEQKHKEVGVLRQQVKDLEKAKQSLASEYEQQLAQFQHELGKLKRSYEKLQRKQMKQSQGEAGNNGADRSEVNRLTRRIEEFRHKALDWEKQRLIFRQQFDTLEMQKKTLTDQSELYQQQSQKYLSQLSSQKQRHEQLEVSSQSEIQHLNTQLQRANDTICSRDMEIERLQIRLEELSGANRMLKEEQLQAQDELQHSRKHLEVLQAEQVELKAALLSQEHFLQNSQSQREEIQKELTRVKENLHIKELSIRSLEESLQNKQASDGATHGRADLEQVMSQLDLSHRTEQSLRVEMTHLNGSVEFANAQCLRLSRELTEKQEELRFAEEQHGTCRSENRKLKEQLSQAENMYNGTLVGMKKEIAHLTQELHQRDISVASGRSSTSNIQHRLRVQMEKEDRKVLENRVVVDPLDTLGLENVQLSEILEKVETSIVRVDDTSLIDLRERCINALNNLVTENQQLQKELSETQARLKLSTLACQEKYECVLLQTQAKLSEIHCEDLRRSRELQQKHEKEMNEMHTELQKKIRQYEAEIQTLKSQHPKLVTNPDSHPITRNAISRNDSLESLCSDFMPGDRSVLPEVDGNEADFSDNTSVVSIPSQRGSDIEPPHPVLASPSGSIATRFLDEEVQRSHQLLERLDSHIEELKKESQKTLNHFAPK
ncbi:centrosomal protein of 63 kDa [Ambystoma mexicanum]|uniref:centrosomal protein of 63 kDa n=1 Tax=Ambystoma mexicanum TaxID=8296 RepID=UPI0037E8F027